MYCCFGLNSMLILVGCQAVPVGGLRSRSKQANNSGEGVAEPLLEMDISSAASNMPRPSGGQLAPKGSSKLKVLSVLAWQFR